MPGRRRQARLRECRGGHHRAHVPDARQRARRWISRDEASSKDTRSRSSSRSPISTPSKKQLAGAPVVKARHKTFYGSEEIYVSEPGGNAVGFAQFPQSAA